MCLICGYIYDEAVGAPEDGIAPGTRWEDVPPELGCSGRTAHRRLRAWEEAVIWDRLHADLLAALKRDGRLHPGTVIVDVRTPEVMESVEF